jgi:SM-20-related protein
MSSDGTMSATPTAIQSQPWASQYSAADVEVIDDYLNKVEQEQMYEFLQGPGWGYGARSHMGNDVSRYWYKHFAGFWEVPTAGLDRHTQAEQELSQYPLVEAMWQKVRGRSRLLRCYANGYPVGAEGGVHKDSMGAEHYTLLYYPHLHWHPDWAGETLFFNERGDDLLCAVYPKPNRLVRFPGWIPHVARGISRLCPLLRITLMFKVSLAN